MNSFFTAVKDGVAILKLNKSKMMEVASKKEATLWAFVILCVPFVANVILAAVQSTFFLELQIKLLLVPLLTTVAVIFAMSLIAQMLFHGKGEHMAFFRVLAYASLAAWVTVVPFVIGLVGGGISVFSIFNLLNLAAGIWMLVVTYHIVVEYYKLNQQSAIVTIVLGIVAAVIFESILGRILIGSFYQFVY